MQSLSSLGASTESLLDLLAIIAEEVDSADLLAPQKYAECIATEIRSMGLNCARSTVEPKCVECLATQCPWSCRQSLAVFPARGLTRPLTSFGLRSNASRPGYPICLPSKYGHLGI